MKNLSIKDEFFSLIKESFFGKNYQERQSYFLKLVKKYPQEVTLLVSLYYNFNPYSSNYLSFLRQKQQKEVLYQNFFDYVRQAVYLLEIGYYKKLLELNNKVPNDFIFALKYFLKGDFLNCNEDFILNLIVKIYSKNELYSILQINKNISFERIEKIYGKKINKLLFPFIFYKKPKGNYQFGFFVKNLDKSYLSFKNTLLEKFIMKQIKFPYLLLGFLYDKQHKTLVPLFYTKNIKVGDDILQNKKFNLQNLNFYPTFLCSQGNFKIKIPQIKKFEFEYEVKEQAKLFIKKHIILNEDGIFSLKFQEKTFYEKVIDYYFENYLIKGVILENNKILKINVTDEIIENGIDNLYIKRKDYLYNNEVFYSQYENLEIYEMRKCVCCNEFFKKSIHSKLCPSCYKEFYDIAKWSMAENFSINSNLVKNDFETNIEKYHIKGYANSKKIEFKRDFSLLPKGYQFVLPFKNP